MLKIVLIIKTNKKINNAQKNISDLSRLNFSKKFNWKIKFVSGVIKDWIIGTIEPIEINSSIELIKIKNPIDKNFNFNFLSKRLKYIFNLFF